MLSEAKALYESAADLIPGWRTMSKQTLANNYIKYEKNPQMRDAYFGALMCRYWNAINKYYMQSCNNASIEECYDWLVHALMYALKHHKWLDPNSKMYNDANGADKVINRCIKSSRLIFYDCSNRDKRKLNFTTGSLEKLEDDIGDNVGTYITDNNNPDIDITKELMIKAFKTADYFKCFMIDGIVNGDTTDYLEENNKRYSQFSAKKLVKHLKNIDSSYCRSLAKRLNLDPEAVISIWTIFSEMPSQKLYSRIKTNILSLRNDPIIKACIAN